MGTRSLTYIYDDDSLQDKKSNPIACIYIQFDGYLEGVGFKLADLLVNKYQENNGMGCLSALLICGLKDNKPFNVYIYPPILNQDAWQEYEYHIHKDKIIVLKVEHPINRTLFEGSYSDFLTYCNLLKKKAA